MELYLVLYTPEYMDLIYYPPLSETYTAAHLMRAANKSLKDYKVTILGAIMVVKDPAEMPTTKTQ